MNLDPTVTTAVFAALEQAVNAALALDPDTVRRLERLDGKVVALRLRGLDTTIYLGPHRGGLRVMSHYEGDPDTVIDGSPFDLMQTGRGNTGGGLFSGNVTIQGDVETGQRFQQILGQLNVDWEEHLSRLTGDVVAHQLGNAARGVFSWIRNAGEKIARDTTEYAQDDARVIPSDVEVEVFLKAVDELRSDTDRLEARLRRLQDRLSPGDT